MSKYRFIGDPDAWNNPDEFNVEKGKIYDGDFIGDGWTYSIEKYAYESEDWELVEEESNNIQPNHYKGNGIQPIDLIESMNMSFNQGNVIKYVSRYKNKNGLEDLLKAKFYLDRMITELETKKE